MDFSLNEEQHSFKTLAKNFAEEKLLPHVKEWDEHQIFPTNALKEAAKLGFGAIYARCLHGGSELSRLDAALIFEELSKACVSTAAYLSIHNMVSALVDNYGNEAQKAQWLPKLASMDCFASYCLTEPSSGSDAASLQTTARREGEYYIVNGSKAFISGGSVSDLYACMVRTGEAGSKGISCLMIEKGTEGLSFGKKEDKLGWRNQPTTMVFFSNCKVPISNQIGELGQGFKIALTALNGGRVNIAACSLGGAQACLDTSIQYMKERKQFNKHLSEFQGLQFKIANMVSELEAARLLVYQAAEMLDKNHPDAALHCAIAKRFASDAAFKISNDAMQLLGGYGYLKEYSIERYFRDLRANQILEGTNEIMMNIIAKKIFEKI